jgi:NDP-sugar pyrophosphorylase family protein
MASPVLTILIPAAGTGERFKLAGYTDPKPLVPVLGKPMLQRIIGNLRPRIQHRVVVISRVNVDSVLTEKDIRIHLSQPTEGAVDTLLKARDHFTTEPLLIANCDQLCAFDVNDFITASSVVDGGIVTFKSNKSHHSYVQVDQWGIVTAIAEKDPISTQAVCGIYYFRHGSDFLHYADQVIKADIRVQNEFYVSSVLDRMVAEGLSFTTYDAPSFMLGTPEELQLFEVAIQVGNTVL